MATGIMKSVLFLVTMWSGACAQTVELNSCGVGGQFGPTKSDCALAYDKPAWLSDVKDGIQTIEIQKTAMYVITATGGAGGNGHSFYTGSNAGNAPATLFSGGNGATVSGRIRLQKGDMLKVTVGQAGQTIPERISTAYHTGGGGGGGTFVERTGKDDKTTLLMAAGGGGGGVAYKAIASSTTYTRGYFGYNGAPGSLTEDGTSSQGQGGLASPLGGVVGLGGEGGDGGNQGGQTDYYNAGAGAGYNGNGVCYKYTMSTYYAYRYSKCGMSKRPERPFIAYQGGSAADASSAAGYSYFSDGGFGGGGPGNYGGGGGGGYSGGGAGLYKYKYTYAYPVRRYDYEFQGGGGGGSMASDDVVGAKISLSAGCGGGGDISGSVTIREYNSNAGKSGSFELSTCGATGSKGPTTMGQCTEKSPDAKFASVKNGVQEVEIVKDGWYKVVATGAKGGGAYGGVGAQVTGYHKLKKGDKYKVVVGQAGMSGEDNDDDDSSRGGGGGGGTFIWESNTQAVVMIAGGGGGAAVGTAPLLDGMLSAGVGAPFGAPGHPLSASSTFTAKGADGSQDSQTGMGGFGWNKLAKGEFKSNGDMGGFGGGGGTSENGGGGGGGYSGGGGGRHKGSLDPDNQGNDDGDGVKTTTARPSDDDDDDDRRRDDDDGYSYDYDYDDFFGGGGNDDGPKASPKIASSGGGGGSMALGQMTTTDAAGSCQTDGSVSFTLVEDFDEDAINTVMFDSCGSVGNKGPTDCSMNKGVTKPSGIKVSDSPQLGVQQVEFTEDGIWTINAAGALGGIHVGVQAGAPTLQIGGIGATAIGTFKFSKGQKVNIVVGQHPQTVAGMRIADGTFNKGAGGGGASVVYRDGEKVPLVVAGGGGGASVHSNQRTMPGAGTGSEVGGNGGYRGGTNGNGGFGPEDDDTSDANGGGSGAGWNNAGTCTDKNLCGKSKKGNWEGGMVKGGADGGFGGGGASKGSGGGGGGGYSGGGGNQGGLEGTAGGGGASYSHGLMSRRLAGGNPHAYGWVSLTKSDVDESTLPLIVNTCGKLGRKGPMKADCEKATIEAHKFSNFKTYKFSATDRGVQTVVIPSGGFYSITAYGARGGHARQDDTYAGGAGASAFGLFRFSGGETISAVVGQSGSICPGCSSSGIYTYQGGAGGGGTFVWLSKNDSAPILIAGGGGGATYQSTNALYHGRPGSKTKDATECESSIYCEIGGKDGNGGTSFTRVASVTYYAGAGAGWLGDGDCSKTTLRHSCGMGKARGWEGGLAGSSEALEGGFGGGGGTDRAGGGGGGYSGGGGGYRGGGGGGSLATGLSTATIQGGNVEDEGMLRIDALPVKEEDLVIMQCGSTGRKGPIPRQCDSAYDADVQVVITEGVQRIRIPSSGEWLITAFGGAGGSAVAFNAGAGTGLGGIGAKAEGKFLLKAGSYINVVVGQQGESFSEYAAGAHGGGGGGGTFVWADDMDEPFVVAGGGGGGSVLESGTVADGGPGTGTSAGGTGSSEGAVGGKNGKGGKAPTPNDDDGLAGFVGGSGAGWLGNGVCVAVSPDICGSGKEAKFAGGQANGGGYVQGGFGGGGGAGATAGGGGGYSGGGSGAGGGGGGSWVSDRSKVPASILEGGNMLFSSGIVIMSRPCPRGESMENGKCTDLDACNLTPCDENADCTDLKGATDGRICKCKNGFTGDGETCSDINACETNPCGPFSTCVDLPPPNRDNAQGRICTCAPGYEPGDDSRCVETNACKKTPCSEHAVCIDFPPPYNGTADGRQCTCPEPFIGDGEECSCDEDGFEPKEGSCQDANACAAFPCMAKATCTDMPPPAKANEEGRMCECVPPFEMNTDTNTCECEAGHISQGDDNCVNAPACSVAPCHQYATCVDLPPPAPHNKDGRECTCKAGFVGDGDTCGCAEGEVLRFDMCLDIDACIAEPCPQNSKCMDLLQKKADKKGRKCSCDRGYELDGDTCRDIDACAGSGCGDNAQCLDKPPPAVDNEDGRSCECNPGYVLNNKGACIDLNECDENPCGSNSKCSDLAPPNFGHTCECDQGWELADAAALDGDCDQDVNACVNNPCADTEMCTDKAAPSPDTSAGRSCADADACMSFPCQENADCTDIVGGSNDVDGRTCKCVDGFRLAGVTCWPDSIFPPNTTTTVVPAMSVMEQPKTMSTVMIAVLVVLLLYGVGATFFMLKSKGTANDLAARQEQNASFTNPAYETVNDVKRQQKPATYNEPQSTFTSNEGSYQDVGPSYAEPSGGYMDVQGRIEDDEDSEAEI